MVRTASLATRGLAPLRDYPGALSQPAFVPRDSFPFIPPRALPEYLFQHSANYLPIQFYGSCSRKTSTFQLVSVLWKITIIW